MTIPPVSIVTGAGSGVGHAVCRRLAALRHRITLVGRTETRLDATVTGLAADLTDPPEVLVVPADVADGEQCRSVVEVTLERWGRIDNLINNAALLEPGPLAEVDADRLYRLFAANVFGPFGLVVAAWPAMSRQRGGRVVNISSMATIDPFPGLAAYAASKSAVESLARSICVEGREHGILGFAVAPGAIETAMLRSLVGEDQLPGASTLDPDEVAAVIEACVTGERDEDAGKTILLPSP